MRLTLRTMLAYLDHVLEPEDAKDLAKKIEESQFASDLMHRIQNVLKLLRLGAPRIDGRGMGADANTVAEYLDNTMPAERVADLERICLESDVHLAEVAAAHQILALVLGEPVKVESRLYDRVYALPQHAAELAAKATQHAPAHNTPAPQAPAHTPPPLDVKAAAGAHVAAPTLGQATHARSTDATGSASAHASTVEDTTNRDEIGVFDHHAEVKPRKLEVPEYLKSPPPKKRGSPVLSLVMLALVFGAIGVFLFRTVPGQKMLAQFTQRSDSSSDGQSTAGKNVAPATIEQPATGTAANGNLEQTNTPGQAPEPPALGSMPKTADGSTVPGASPSATAPAAAMPAAGAPPAGTATAPLAPLPPGTSNPTPTPPTTPAAATPSTATPAATATTTPGTSPPATAAATTPAAKFTPLVTPPATATTPVNVTPPPVTPPPTPMPMPEPPKPAAAAVVAMGTVSAGDAVTVGLPAGATGGWKRLGAQAPISSGDKLQTLPGYRSALALAYGLNLQLPGSSQIELVAPDEYGVPGIYLHYGRLIVTPAGKADAQLRLGGGYLSAPKQGSLTFGSSDTIVALEVRPMPVLGNDPLTTESPLVVDLYVAQGEISWQDPGSEKPIKLTGPVRLPLGIPPTPGSPEEKSLPNWIVSDDRNDVEQLAAPVVEKESRDKVVSLALKELADDRRSEVRLLAMRGLMYLGEYDRLVTALRDENHARNWDALIDSLREACSLGAATAGRVKQAFESHRGAVKGSELYRMVVGYNAEQLGRGAAASLVKALDHEDLDFRVVSYNQLKRISPRTVSTYRPTDTAPKRRPNVLKWEQMLERGELTPK